MHRSKQRELVVEKKEKIEEIQKVNEEAAEVLIEECAKKGDISLEVQENFRTAVKVTNELMHNDRAHFRVQGVKIAVQTFFSVAQLGMLKAEDDKKHRTEIINKIKEILKENKETKDLTNLSI